MRRRRLDATMPQSGDLQSLFEANLTLIERIVAAIVRRHGLRDDDARDCASWIKLRLIEDDFAALRRFRGESSLATYLTVVIASLYRDYHVKQWGRWRPSAAARRLGPAAVRLETLLYRRGYGLREATELLRNAGFDGLSDRDVARMLKQLPARSPMRPVAVGPELVDQTPSTAGAAAIVDEGIAADEQRAIDQALTAALDRLEPEDRLVLRMRYWEGASVADIARALGLDQKPLYRRIERLLHQLREQLEAAGVSRAEARTLWEEMAS